MKTELINKFLANACTAKEAEEVVRYLQQHPEVLEQFLPKEEWDMLSSATDQEDIFKEKPAVYARLSSQIEQKRRFAGKRKLAFQIAACLLLLVIAGIFFQFPQKNKQITELPLQPEAEQPSMSYNIRQINEGNQPMHLTTTDGSIITLYPGSELRYPETFDGLTSRSFHLRGQATFQVATDPHRPFMVYSQHIVTTALGTTFTIDAPQNRNQVQVTLLEGKVLVKDEASGETSNHFAHYLNPGDRLVINTQTFASKLSPTAKPPLMKTENRGTWNETDSTLYFDNLPLKEVFLLLKTKYNMTIRYRDQDISKHYYTGHFKKEPNIAEKILQDVVLLNHFTLDKLKGEYIINNH